MLWSKFGDEFLEENSPLEKRLIGILISDFRTLRYVTPSWVILPLLTAKSSVCFNPILYIAMNPQVSIYNFNQNTYIAKRKVAFWIPIWFFSSEVLSKDSSNRETRRNWNVDGPGLIVKAYESISSIATTLTTTMTMMMTTIWWKLLMKMVLRGKYEKVSDQHSPKGFKY